MPDRIKFAAFGCTHCPLQDDEAVAWAVEQVARHKPDVVVHLGDGHEADSASRWPTEYDWSLEDEFDAHNTLLAKFRKAAPDAQRIMLPGNHDANLSACGRIDKRLRSLADFRKHEPEMAHWRMPASYVYCRKTGCWRLGEVVFAHGYECGQSSDRDHAIYFANEFGLYVGAHTHRPTPDGAPVQCRMTATRPLRYWYANVGCLRDLKPDYMARKRSELWGQAVVLGSVEVTKSPRRDRTWEAETRIFRMFDR
jgi:predicted phosphodiesterase